MIKVFISQPMRGKTDEEILQKRNETMEKLSKEFSDEFTIIDSFFQDISVSEEFKSEPLFYLGKSLELLATADIAVFIEGWEDARGCVMEHLACEKYGIKTLEV